MAQELATKESKVLSRVDRYLSLTAMTLPEDMDFDHWAKIGDGRNLMRRVVNNQSLAFYVGDWLRYGESAFGNDELHERYSEAIKVTGYNGGTLYNCKYVASSVPPERRREELSWSHHQAVASLPAADQDYLLQTAVTDGLSIGQLRQMVAAMKNGSTEAESEVLGKEQEPRNEEEQKQKEVGEALAELKQDVPVAQQMAEDFFTLSNAFLDTLTDAGSVDRKSVANFQATAKSLSEVCIRIFKDLVSLT